MSALPKRAPDPDASAADLLSALSGYLKHSGGFLELGPVCIYYDHDYMDGIYYERGAHVTVINGKKTPHMDATEALREGLRAVGELI